MSAAEALRAAVDAGIKLQLDGDDLVLEAAAPPPPDVLDLLVRHKRDIIPILLRPEQHVALFGSNFVCANEIVERAGLIEGAHGCISSETRCCAPEGVGGGFTKAFNDNLRTRIEAALNQLPAPCDHNGRRLSIVTRKFVGSHWFSQAFTCGWTLEELFGVDAHAPLARYEQWGLVVGLALSQ